MIVHSLCNSCLQPYQILFEPSDVPLVKEIADEKGFTCPCPRLCGGHINIIGEPTLTAMATDKRTREPLHITGKELYKAVNGAGLPDEVPNSGELVDSLLRANKIKDLQVEVAEGKVYLHSIELENGATLHLSAGRRGAQVIKVTQVSK